MNKKYNSINATYGSSALDLSTLPAYEQNQTRKSARIINFEDVASRPVRTHIKKSKKDMVIDSVNNHFYNRSLLAPLFNHSKAQLPVVEVSFSQLMFPLLGFVAFVSCILYFFG